MSSTGWQATDAELLRAFGDAEADLARIWFQQVERVREMDRRGIVQSVGASSLKAFLGAGFRLSAADAKALVEAADQLVTTSGLADAGQPKLPATAAAAAKGHISPSHVRVITHTMAELPPIDAEQREWAEEFLVDKAGELGPTDLAKVGLALQNRFNPDGTLPHDALRRRELTFNREYDGMIGLRGRLDPEGAAIIRAALDPLAAPHPETDADGKDTRSAARRHADALIDLADRLLRLGRLPTTAGERPQLRITIPLAALSDGAGLGDTEWGDHVDAGTARRLACDAHLIPAVLGTDSEVLDIGRATRIITTGIRRALTLRDRGCAFPGCHRPSPWTDAHHITHWADGGPTSLPNLVLLCGQHHRLLHHQHWHVTITNHTAWFHPPWWTNAPPRRNHLHHLTRIE